MPRIVLTPKGDTYISRRYADANFSSKRFLVTGFECWRSNLFKSLIKFENPILPDECIFTGACLKLYVGEVYGKCVPVRVDNITCYFDPKTVTWNTAPNTTPTSCTFDVHPQNVGGFIEVDISDLVYGWIRGKIPNHGLALVGGSCNRDSAVAFASSNYNADFAPRLIIEYKTHKCGPCGATGPTGPAGPAGPPGGAEARRRGRRPCRGHRGAARGQPYLTVGRSVVA